MTKLMPGSLCQFIGYSDEVGATFSPGDILAVCSIDEDGVMTCCEVDYRGRVFSIVSDAVFIEEVRLLDLAPIPLKRLPPPWGVSDNEEDEIGLVWTGRPVGSA